MNRESECGSSKKGRDIMFEWKQSGITQFPIVPINCWLFGDIKSLQRSLYTSNDIFLTILFFAIFYSLRLLEPSQFQIFYVIIVYIWMELIKFIFVKCHRSEQWK